jgi:hypothetical protein
MTPYNLLTLSILTIPERTEYLGRLLESIRALGLDPQPRIDVVYNRALDGALSEVVEGVRAHAPSLPIEVYFNASDTSIAAGRNLQLSVCRTPLIAFVDDDLTLHGNVIPGILDTLATHPVGLVGFPSLEGSTQRQVKPRDSTPSVVWDGLRYMPVQGMLCAGYRALFAGIGGFNPRRRMWGEWTELNLRMWRSGFPTAYNEQSGYLRHWHEAPESPTRNLSGRERHVVWGLICTALEYDAVDVNEATEVFWHLVEERYLAYSYGNELSPRNVLKTVLELVPQISAEWGAIQAFRALTSTHPFSFKPFQRFTQADVETVHAHARTAIRPFRKSLSLDAGRISDPAMRVLPRAQRTLGSEVRRLVGSIRKLRSQM